MSRTVKWAAGLALLSLCVLAGLFAWAAYWSRQAASARGFWVTTDRTWMWIGDEVILTTHVDPTIAGLPATRKAIQPAEVVLVLDRSGSMSGPPMVNLKRAARILTRSLAGPEIRFAVVAFDSTAETLCELTGDAAVLERCIDRVSANGGTQLAAGLRTGAEAFRAARPEGPTRRVVLLMTDCEANDVAPAATEAEQLRRTLKAKVYVVGLVSDPHKIDPIKAEMMKITDDASAVVITDDPQQIARKFLGVGVELAAAMIEGLGIRLRVAPSALRMEGIDQAYLDALDPDSGEANWNLPAYFGAQVDLPLRLKARAGGLHRVPIQPATASFVEDQSRVVVTRQTRAEPRVLVLSPLFLLWFLLPPLVPFLAGLLRFPGQPVEIIPDPIRPAPPVYRQPEPPRLRRPVRREPIEAQAVPTLVIGLGGSGRGCIDAMRSSLDSLWGIDPRGTDIRQLVLDLATREYEPVESNAAIALSSTTPEALASRVAALAETAPPHLAWFDPRPYHGAPATRFDLSRGSDGDRMLARLHLWEDVDRGAHVLRETYEEVVRLMERPSADHLRRVVVVAGTEGGVGSGWALDLCVQIRALARRLQRDRPNLRVPETVLVLLSSPDAQPDAAQRHRLMANRTALLDELDRFVLAGTYPFPVHVVESRGPRAIEIVAQSLDEFPIDHVFLIDRPAPVETRLWPEAADVVALLTERNLNRSLVPRLLGRLFEHDWQRSTTRRALIHSVGCSAVVFPVARLIERARLLFAHAVAMRFLERADWNDLRAETGPDPAQTRRLWEAWTEPVPGLTPLDGFAALIHAATNGPAAPLFVSWAATRSADMADDEWREDFEADLSRHLRMIALHRLRQGSWTIGEAQAAAHLGSERFAQVTPGPEAAVAVQIARDAFRRLAADAEGWQTGLGQLQQAASQGYEAKRTTEPNGRRHEVDDDVGDPEITARRILERQLSGWLDGDWRQSLRERTWLEADADGRLGLVLFGTSRRRVEIDQASALVSILGDTMTEWFGSFDPPTILRKLAGPAERPPYTTDPAQIVSWLPREDATRHLEGHTELQLNFLTLPVGARVPVMARDVEVALRDALQPWERLEVVPVRERYAIRMLSLVPHCPTTRVRRSPERPAFNRLPERNLQALAELLGKTEQRQAPNLHPCLALAARNTDRLAAFARAWVGGAIAPTEDLAAQTIEFVLSNVLAPAAGPPEVSRQTRIDAALTGWLEAAPLDLERQTLLLLAAALRA